MARLVKGIAVSPGLVLGSLAVWNPQSARSGAESKSGIGDARPTAERWDEAKQTVLQLLESLRRKTAAEAGQSQSEIFLAQQMILEDPAFEQRVFDGVAQGMTLPEAVDNGSNGLAGEFEQLDNAYMRERAEDIRDIGRQLKAVLTGASAQPFPQLTGPAVLAARDLTPSQTAQIDKSLLQGIILEKGGRTSHTAILAGALGIPAVVAVTGLNLEDLSDSRVLVDGNSGTVILDPGPAELQVYQDQLMESPTGPETGPSGETELRTADGFAVLLSANIGSADELPALSRFNCGGIGLCRTEFLFLRSDHWPDEAEQFEAYQRITQTVAPHPVIFRTLDIGGDKRPSYIQPASEENPFLGLRSIRFSLQYRDRFKTQIRALLRASVYGKIKIMFPMITMVEEYKAAREIAAEVETELIRSSIPFSEVEWGIMIEVPAAALLADVLAEEVDFFSIGTNDLIQYMMAADRLNEAVSYLYQPFHPAVLRVLDMIISAGHRAGIPVGMCGEMAGMPEAVPLLLGLGLDEFSMSPVLIPRVRQMIAQTSRAKMQGLASQALKCRNSEAVLAVLKCCGAE
jgi:phosphotransferase system enzyme I (PtsI)